MIALTLMEIKPVENPVRSGCDRPIRRRDGLQHVID